MKSTKITHIYPTLVPIVTRTNTGDRMSTLGRRRHPFMKQVYSRRCRLAKILTATQKHHESHQKYTQTIANETKRSSITTAPTIPTIQTVFSSHKLVGMRRNGNVAPGHARQAVAKPARPDNASLPVPFIHFRTDGNSEVFIVRTLTRSQ